MELKAIKEYKSPEYPTTEESKNRILMMMARTGKISLGVAVMCLLCNCSFANNFYFSDSDVDMGAMPIEINQIGPGIYGYAKQVCILGIIGSLLVTMFFSLKSHSQYKICEDIEEKQRFRGKRNETLIKGGLVIAICILLIMNLKIIGALSQLRTIIGLIYLSSIIITLIVSAFFSIKNHRKYKICDDVDEKERFLNKRNEALFIGSVVIIFLIVFIIFINFYKLFNFFKFYLR